MVDKILVLFIMIAIGRRLGQPEIVSSVCGVHILHSELANTVICEVFALK